MWHDGARWGIRALSGIGAALALITASAHAADPPKVRHGYVDMRYGQLHYAIMQPPGGSTKTPIVLFHQSPNSSMEYDALITELGKDRVAIAIDTPGHGASDGPTTQPKIEDYAAAIAEGLKNLGYGPDKPIDIFGNHTGSRISTELALTNPKMVRHVMLGLSPYALIDDKLAAKLLTEVVHPASGTAMLEAFCPTVPRRATQAKGTGVDDPIWVRIALESLRATTRHEYGHAAAYEYGPRFKARLLQLTQPVLMLVIDDPVDEYQSGKTAADMSRQLKPLLTKSPDVEILENNFHNDAFYARAKDVADGFRRFVDKP